MAHIATVLDVAETFEKDLKGGTGYEGMFSALFLVLLSPRFTNRQDYGRLITMLSYVRRHAQLHVKRHDHLPVLTALPPCESERTNFSSSGGVSWEYISLGSSSPSYVHSSTPAKTEHDIYLFSPLTFIMRVSSRMATYIDSSKEASVFFSL